MDSNTLWQRYQKHLCRVPALGLTLDISRMRFDDGFFERMAAAHAEGLRGHGRAGARGDRQPRRKPHGRPLLAACARPGTVGGDRRRDPQDHRGDQEVRGVGAPRRGPSAAGCTVHARAVDRHRRLGARPDVRCRRAGQSRRCDEDRLPRQHRPRRHRAHPANTRRAARRDALSRRLQERRHAGDAQRHAAGGRGLPPGGA